MSATSRQPLGKPAIWALRLALAVFLLACWQFLPQIKALQEFSPVFDPFFVSSPQRVVERLIDLATGSDGQPEMWSYLWATVKATLLGVLIGTALGAAFGLFLSNSRTAQEVLRPFMAFLNATPRIALVPIFVIIAGPTLTMTVITSVAVVFFLVFYNAQAGGGSVPGQVVQNARLLGATGAEVMWRIRLRYVLVWTMLSLPNAISFGLVAVVTAEILTGQVGMGRLLLNSITTVDATLTFAVVIVLAFVGVILVTAAEVGTRRALHWWTQS
jgi:NitT/TauT family transport system permease protein